MADEPVKQEGAEPIIAGATPAVDMDQIAARSHAAAKEGMAEFLQEERARLQQQARVQARVPQPSENPLEPVVMSVAQPHVNRAIIEARDAKDAAMFYAEHPEGLKYKKEIEEAFDQLKAQGTPFNRDACYNWVKGKNLDHFVTEGVKARDLAVERAQNATSVDSGGRGAGAVPARDPYKMNDEDLNKAVAGVAF